MKSWNSSRFALNPFPICLCLWYVLRKNSTFSIGLILPFVRLQDATWLKTRIANTNWLLFLEASVRFIVFHIRSFYELFNIEANVGYEMNSKQRVWRSNSIQRFVITGRILEAYWNLSLSRVCSCMLWLIWSSCKCIYSVRNIPEKNGIEYLHEGMESYFLDKECILVFWQMHSYSKRNVLSLQELVLYYSKAIQDAFFSMKKSFSSSMKGFRTILKSIEFIRFRNDYERSWRFLYAQEAVWWFWSIW